MKYIVYTLVTFMSVLTTAQVKIGDNPNIVDGSAMLEIESTSKGLIMPRLTTAQRDAIVSPATGLTVYNASENCLQVYNGVNWTPCFSASPVRANCLDWLNNGGTTSGVYKIDPDGTGGNAPFDCYCDQTTDGGGWALVWSNIRQVTGKHETNMNWNTAINTLPLVRSGTSLSSPLDQFQVYTGLSHWSTIGTQGKLRYTWANTGTVIDQAFNSDFTLTGSTYVLTLTNYAQTSGATVAGLFNYHSGRPFTTIDADNDAYGSNCSGNYSNTPFWYGSCWDGSMNGGGENQTSGHYNGSYWDGSALQWGTDSGIGAGNGWIWVK